MGSPGWVSYWLSFKLSIERIFMKLGLKAALIIAVSCPAANISAFENTKVLPKNIRSLNIRTVETNIANKTDQSGDPKPLAQPLNQDLTFAKMVKSESALKASQLNAFLTSNGFSDSDVVGTFSADLKAHVRVTAPIVSYGITEKLTFAAAFPIYQAQTAVDVGFTPTPRARQFLAALASTENNQTASAREVGDKLNHAVERLNQKLADNGFRTLRNWEDQGLGDVTLAGKFRGYENESFAIATTGGIVLPTGRTDDADVLNDLAFGDGQTDVFAQLATDQFLGYNLTLNEFAKYTEQLPGRKQVRLVTEDEKVEVAKSDTEFKLGSKWEAGGSLQWEPTFGLVAGIGLNHMQKRGDRYQNVPAETQRVLEAKTDQQANNSLVQLGYSTLPLFRAQKFPIPLETKFTYTRQLSSKNLPQSDLAQIDFSLFF
jgi:hypothetical protein